MRLADIIELPEPQERVRRMCGRLIPLCQGEALYARPQSVQTFFALYLLRGEVRNGSLRQYFANSAGDTWRLAREALTGSELEAEFGAALALFPGGEPSLDRGKRYHQLAEVDIHAFTALSRRIIEHEAALVEAMARHLAAHAADFRFVDRYPNGFKALAMPAVVDLADFSVDDPFRLITATYAAMHDKGGPRGPIEQRFLDVFSFADEVSVAGFEAYFFTRAADRHIDTLVGLRGLGLEETAQLLDQAIAVVPGTLADDATPRRVQLKALTEAGRASLEGHSRTFQSHRTPLAIALAKYVAEHLSLFAA